MMPRDATPSKGTASRDRKDYVLAVQAQACRVRDGVFATESAFAVHLKVLRSELSSDFDRLVLLAPEAKKSEYDKNPSRFGLISEQEDGIKFIPAYPAATSPKSFILREAVPLWRRLGAILPKAGYIHSGLSANIWRPYLFLVNARAMMQGIPSTFVIDIDFRKMSERRYRTGMWSWKNYAVNRMLHDNFKRAQLWLAVRTSKLVLLKSASMVSAYGAGRANVRDFLDAAHSASDVVSDEELETRLAEKAQASGPLEVVYFGRFVSYKGLDLALAAVQQAIGRGANIRLTLIGDGEDKEKLLEQANSPALKEAVTFISSVPYGRTLFDLVDRADVTIACPKGEDTPRAALDSLARGLPVVAFDIDYFANLAEKSGAVVLAEWPSAEKLADQLVALAKNRSGIAEMARKGVVFARANTQEIWLKRRMQWTKAAARQSP